MYISKGMVVDYCTEVILEVSRCNQKFTLTDVNAAMWLNGRLGISRAINKIQECSLNKLARMGLVECTDETDTLGQYRLLSSCVICPAKLKRIRKPLNKKERWLLRWMNEAGLRLTMGELVFLSEHNIEPLPELIGEDNRQALVETIYASQFIEKGLLDIEMERAVHRDEVVETILHLLAKKYILLL